MNPMQEQHLTAKGFTDPDFGPRVPVVTAP